MSDLSRLNRDKPVKAKGFIHQLVAETAKGCAREVYPGISPRTGLRAIAPYLARVFLEEPGLGCGTNAGATASRKPSARLGLGFAPAVACGPVTRPAAFGVFAALGGLSTGAYASAGSSPNRRMA